MRLKSALRRGVAAAVIAGIVVSSGIPAYAAPWNIADGDITVKAGDTEGTNWVSQGEKEDVKDTDTVITGESDKNTVTIDTSKGDVDVTFDDLKIDVSGKTEVDGSGDGSTRESNAAVTVQGGGDATIELDGDNKLKSGSNNAGLEKNKQESKGTLTIKDDKGKDGSLTAEGGEGGAGIGGGAESGIVPVFGSVKASDAGEDLTSRDVVLIESAAPRSTVTTDIPSLREDGVEDIFFRYEDTMTHYSVDKMADAAGEDADVELKQNREDISLRLDGETRDDLSERYQEWVPVQTPEPQERLILTHKEVEQKTSEELRRELDELRKQELEMGFQFAKKRDDLPSLDWWLEPARAETVKQKTSEELRRELDESLKQLAARFEDIAPEEDKKPLLVLVEPSGTERKKYIDPLESDLRRYTDLSDDWDDLPDTQGEIKLWIPEDLEKAKLWIPEDLGHLISPSKESLSGIDGIA